jgi:LPXTG-site transpeptidase (sortase) family protein
MQEIQPKKEKFLDFVKSRRLAFFFNFFIVCLITFSVLYLFGFVPEELQMSFGRAPEPAHTAEEIKTGEFPLRVVISSIGVDTQVYNPESTSTEVLDSYLLKGAVRYPGSGLLGYGNIFIFGHSTGFKIVNNQAYKTFSGLRNVKKDDQIFVFSNDNEFLYKVSSVKLETADKALVEFDTTKQKLTISTCNTFGAKEDRYVVEADYVGKRKITK